jgi:hypothetical protein
MACWTDKGCLLPIASAGLFRFAGLVLISHDRAIKTLDSQQIRPDNLSYQVTRPDID